MSSDIETTRYTIKANIETTRYFNSPETDIEQQVNQNTQDISDIKTDLNTITNEVSTKESITSHNSDISNLQSQINSTASALELKESTTSHNTDISNIQASIASIPINPYEGLFYSRYGGNNVIIEFNYNLGNMIFWPDGTGLGSYNTSINNVDTTNHVELSSDIETLILPGTIKKLNSDGTINTIIRKLYYVLDPTTTPGRKLLNNLKTITVLPDVWRIELNCLGTPNLSSLNLFNGLQKLSLGNMYNINYLKIPSTVNECWISNCIFMDLSFEPSNIELKLTYTDNRINNKLKIMRKLSSDSSINVSNSSSIDYPPSVLECDVRVLNKIANNSSLSNGTVNIDTFTQLNLRCMAFDNTPVFMVSLNHSLKFNRILVLCQLQIYVGVENLTANEWYTVA